MITGYPVPLYPPIPQLIGCPVPLYSPIPQLIGYPVPLYLPILQLIVSLLGQSSDISAQVQFWPGRLLQGLYSSGTMEEECGIEGKT